MHIFGIEVLVSSLRSSTLFFLFPLPFFSSPPLRVNRRRRRRRYVVFARCFHRFCLIDALLPE